MITILDYGMGNLGSIKNMFRRLGVSASIETEPSGIKDAKKIVLPGIGAFDNAMKNIFAKKGLIDILKEKVLFDKVPILGVCLGMQLLTFGSEEGDQPGFGFIPASTIRLPKLKGIKVPHMGWNYAVPNDYSNALLSNFEKDTRYYFVHSYAVQVEDPKYSLMKTTHGIEFDSAISYENVYGVQFHPEKSHKHGMHLLKNFAEL
jgi:glutamine amidotransferase